MLSPSHEDNDQYDRLLTENPFADSQTAALIEPDIEATPSTSSTAPKPKQQQPPETTPQRQTQLQEMTSNMYSGEDTLDEPVITTIVINTVSSYLNICRIQFFFFFFYVIL